MGFLFGLGFVLAGGCCAIFGSVVVDAGRDGTLSPSDERSTEGVAAGAVIVVIGLYLTALGLLLLFGGVGA